MIKKYKNTNKNVELYLEEGSMLGSGRGLSELGGTAVIPDVVGVAPPPRGWGGR